MWVRNFTYMTAACRYCFGRFSTRQLWYFVLQFVLLSVERAAGKLLAKHGIEIPWLLRYLAAQLVLMGTGQWLFHSVYREVGVYYVMLRFAI